eukprot:6003975-Amphidinium_carterae.1
MNHLAVPPQQCIEGGHAKRKVRRLLERQHKETMLMVPVLMPQNCKGVRLLRSFEMVPPHLHLHACTHSYIMEMVASTERAKGNNQLPAQYWENAIVKANPEETVIPLTLFIDGMEYDAAGNSLL